MTTANEVLDMLRRHYLPEGRPAGGLFAPEIGSPCGTRRADLLWVPTSRTGAHSDNIIGHEVKVSRSDILTELADPTKADPWARYCTRWWLVIPDPSLITGLQMPDMWGVYAPPSGRRTRSMTVLKPAPRLKPDGDLSPALTRLTAYMVNRVEARVAEVERQALWDKSTIERQEKAINELRLAADHGGSMSPHVRRLATILAEVKKRSREIGWWVREADDAAVIEALVSHSAVMAAAQSTRRSIEMAMRALAAREVREQLEAVAALLPEAVDA